MDKLSSFFDTTGGQKITIYFKMAHGPSKRL